MVKLMKSDSRISMIVMDEVLVKGFGMREIEKEMGNIFKMVATVVVVSLDI